MANTHDSRPAWPNYQVDYELLYEMHHKRLAQERFSFSSRNPVHSRGHWGGFPGKQWVGIFSDKVLPHRILDRLLVLPLLSHENGTSCGFVKTHNDSMLVF